MRKFIGVTTIVALSLLANEAWARGGGGGGGRGAGGGARGFSGGQRGGNEFRGPGDFRGGLNGFGADGIGGFSAGEGQFRGGQGEFRGGLDRSGTGESRNTGPQTIFPEAAGRGALGEGLQAGPRGDAATRTGAGQNDNRGAAARAAAGRPNRAGDPAQNKALRNDRYNDVNRQLANQGNDLHGLFNNDFWRNNPHPHWGFRGDGGRWWGRPAWGALAAWGAWGWGEPIPYNYGDNVYYDGNTVYDDGEAVASSEEYAQQAEDIATNVPQANADNVEWMPLGVFALSMDGEAKGPKPTIFLQLAISKEGIVAGTYINTASDGKQSLEGSVDRKSQRVAWTVVDQKWPVFETGIYNLTQDTAPILVHFADGQTQQRLLVRVNQPADGDNVNNGAKDGANDGANDDPTLQQ